MYIEIRANLKLYIKKGCSYLQKKIKIIYLPFPEKSSKLEQVFGGKK